LTHAKIQHPKDVEYFGEYPAPLMEMMQAQHFTNINSTIAFFGPMLYFLLREIGAEQVLEIGHAEGYTAFYMAHAVKDNAVRFGMAGNKYYGIDIVQTEKVRTQLLESNLPVDLRELDSMKLTPETFPGINFDVIFQDGCHDTEHVLYELKTLYPQLKGEGKGYWIFHDCFGPAEEGFQEVMKLIKADVYDFEFIRFFTPYGLAILRKMEGWNLEKRYWTP
jgi:SAM-dependent methyltransferase